MIEPNNVTIELMSSMKAKIGEALETTQVYISDAYGDGRHVSIDVVSTMFEGKNSMSRQRMVYKVGYVEEVQGIATGFSALAILG